MSDPPQPDLVRLDGGTLRIGSESGRPDEQPVHTLEIAPLRVAIAPVTNREYAAFLGTGHELPRFWAEERFNAPEQPVVGVNWFDGVAYCEWLAGETGVKYRLPTEGEREYASLGGLQAVDWPWPGSRWQDHPNATELAGGDRPHAPTPKCANGYGLRCVAENVHEWCRDWYHADGYERGPLSGDQKPLERARRVSRGGSWRHSVKFTRLTARASLAPERRYNDFGFRLYADA